MLHALAEHLDSFDAVVSFNGRGFDMPLLDARFRLARMRPRILRVPHLDLLPPARRMWRGRLESCALSALERDVLGVWRDQADVPGELIPGLYLNYIQTGDASEMPRVMYHNAIDILSMVTLSARLMTLLTLSLAPSREAGGMKGEAANAGDLLAIGKWRDQLGQIEEAEAALRDCLNADPDPATRSAALHRLGHLLKRLDRRAEAVPLWEVLSESKTVEGVEACVELAKYHEWHAVDLDRAIVFTRKAIIHARRVTPDYLRDQLEADLAHRLTRLTRKRA
jgi:tetratricopeptide (TPR) repeat protein